MINDVFQGCIKATIDGYALNSAPNSNHPDNSVNPGTRKIKVVIIFFRGLCSLLSSLAFRNDIFQTSISWQDVGLKATFLSELCNHGSCLTSDRCFQEEVCGWALTSLHQLSFLRCKSNPIDIPVKTGMMHYTTVMPAVLPSIFMAFSLHQTHFYVFFLLGITVLPPLCH